MTDSKTPVFAVPDGFSADAEKVSALKEELGAKGVQYLFSSYVDIHGVPKAKINPIECLEKMANGSELFTVGALEGMGLVGPQIDECAAVPDLDTAIVCPWDNRFAYFFGDLYYHGAPYENDSRQVLKRQLERANAMGLKFNLGVEPEFYVLKENGDTGKWEQLPTHRYRGVCPSYDINQSFGSMDFLEPFSDCLRELEWGLYSFDQEGGHGQYEFDFGYADALTTADRLTFFRVMAKQVAESIGAVATFMPKPFADDARSGCHNNMSLASLETGENLFTPESESNPFAEKLGIPLSKLAFHFIAGVLKHAPAITAVSSPTYNSYQGFIAQGDMPDISWAPVLAAYGRNNRSAMLRLPQNRYCVENRAPDMSNNPYLTAAMHLAAGLDGIEQELDPGEPINANAYNLSRAELKKEGINFLPATLKEALDAFEDDPFTVGVLGEMKEIFLKQKRWEWEQSFYPIHDRQLNQFLTHV
ncbi:MAG: type III glutamate--ammonia ligase [Verrucomicrobiales bacterium]|nr:type III glutamate--ammonia ligase [Verrucomicrobiales bacterium]